MRESTVSASELLFDDADAARAYLEAIRWPDGPVCPACAEPRRITTRRGGYYRCNACKADFSVRTGTIFERSRIPLDTWLAAMHILATAATQVSSYQLADRIGVAQRSGWLMIQRLREACGGDLHGFDQITASVLNYRPKDKGLAAEKIRRRMASPPSQGC